MKGTLMDLAPSLTDTTSCFTHTGGSGSYRRGLFWEGIFADPGAQRIADAYGSASGSVTVRLRVAESDGSIGNANSTVPLSEGYG